jgi:hypothetical protein
VITVIKTKQDLVKALAGNSLLLRAEVEVVNESGVKSLVDKAKALLRQQKKLHVIFLERH